MDSLITIDVEGGPKPNRYSCVDRVDALLDRLDATTTLFVTPDVVQARPETVDAWRGDHLVGLHIHPARLAAGRTEQADQRADFLTGYSRPEIASLVSDGLTVFEEVLDYRPTVFRAGRWEYSKRLLSVLNSHGFSHDASLRPSEDTSPYRQQRIQEVPMTVSASTPVKLSTRFVNIDTVPLHTDAFLKRRTTVIPFYVVTRLLLRSERPYLMVSLHDYDLEPDTLSQRIERYLRWLRARTVPTTVEEIRPAN